MKKKFILIFSMVALVVCLFAISVSASNYIDLNSLDFTNLDFSQFTVYSSKKCEACGFSSPIEEEFGVVHFSTSKSDAVGFLNVEYWHSLLTQNGIDSYEEFHYFYGEMTEMGMICDCSSGIGYQIGSYAEDYFPVYQSYVAEITAPTYEDGKIEGVTEFKASEEYENTINEAEQNAIVGFKSSVEYNATLQGEYNRGKDEGVEAYKSSTAYKNVLDIRYQTGLADGKANYIESAEYKEALQVEYDEGFEAGTEESDTNEIGTTLLSIVGSALLGVALVWVINVAGKKKRRRR